MVFQAQIVETTKFWRYSCLELQIRIPTKTKRVEQSISLSLPEKLESEQEYTCLFTSNDHGLVNASLKLDDMTNLIKHTEQLLFIWLMDYLFELIKKHLTNFAKKCRLMNGMVIFKTQSPEILNHAILQLIDAIPRELLNELGEKNKQIILSTSLSSQDQAIQINDGIYTLVFGYTKPEQFRLLFQSFLQESVIVRHFEKLDEIIKETSEEFKNDIAAQYHNKNKISGQERI